MISALLALTLMTTADSLLLVVNGRDSAIAARAEGQVTYVSADAAATALGGRVQRLPNHRFLLSVGGVAFEIADRSSFALSDGRLYPLLAPARERDGRLEETGILHRRRAARRRRRMESRESPPRRRRRARWPGAGQLAARHRGTPTVAPAPLAPRWRPPAPARSRRGRRPRAASGGASSSSMPGTAGVTECAAGVRPHARAGEDVVLGVARRLEQELENRGYAVVMTRSSDTLVALDDRGKIANRSKGDLFISVHVNAANPKWRDPQAARGFETYFRRGEDRGRAPRGADGKRSGALRDRRRRARHDPLGFIINDMAQNEHLRESSDLPTASSALRRCTGPSRGVKQAGFRVLVKAYMPAVLVEIGFGTNAAEAAYLISESGQRALASAIAEAAAEYGRYEQRVGNGK